MQPHLGSWTIAGLPTPDLNITETIARLLGRPSNDAIPDWIQPISPGRPKPQNFNNVLSATDTTNAPRGVDSGLNYNFPIPLPTSGGGSTGQSLTQGVSDPNQGAQDAANLAFNAALAQANSLRSRGQQTFQDLIKSVNAFRDRSLEQKNTGDQNIRNIAAENLGSNAKTAQQLAGSANAQGRNLGLSSKVNLGQRILGNLEGTQGSTLATRGTNLSNNENLYNSRLDQAQANEDQANQYLQQVNDAASNLATGGVSNYASNLQSIVERANALAALSPLNAGGLSAYSPDFSGITNTLNNITSSVPSAAANPGTGVDAGNLFNDPTFQAYLRKNLGLYQG